MRARGNYFVRAVSCKSCFLGFNVKFSIAHSRKFNVALVDDALSSDFRKVNLEHFHLRKDVIAREEYRGG